MNPPCCLKQGDVVECEIDGMGKLSNGFATAQAPGRAA
jgi:2-keto-4-pentenoate hydratase/2-oxohepta-3-ene-1,7-dioic acid hydratase in catechol pathway